ncbi:MAG: hypothetical protein ACR2QA_08700 [Solirubrobacteraceae bacterium]
MPPRRWVLATVAAAVALGGAGWLIGQQFTSSTSLVHRRTTKPALSTAAPGLVTFQDPAGGFAGSYPASWQRVPTSDPGVVLVVSAGDGSASLEVRKTPIGAPVNAANLGAAKKITDRVVRGGKDVKYLRQPQQVVLGGLPGYLYLYTFADPTSGQMGAHAHYFLFQGSTMISLVFQALPAQLIYSLAPMFDRLAATFRAVPG